MAIFASKDFTVARNGNNGIKGFYSTVSSKKKFPPVGLNLIISGSTDYHCFNSLFIIYYLTNWTSLVCACKSEICGTWKVSLKIP